jgi:acetyl-CoA acetyltransferase
MFIAEIPYGAYWSTPFTKWQGSFANLHSIAFAAHVARQELAKRQIAPEVFDYGVLGLSVPQKGAFFGLPWLMGMIGANGVGGPTLAQACATGVRCLLAGAQEIAAGLAGTALIAACDRTSNGPHLYYPNPAGAGGTGKSEDWVLDNFGCDPLGGHSMLQTAENVARKYQVDTAQQHEIVLRRQAQYGAALADDAAFLKRFMTLPFAVPDAKFAKTVGTIAADEGITASTAEGLARLRPVLDGGSVTFGGQTHPADGNAALLLATPDQARQLSRAPEISIRLRGFGQARVELAFMPEATIPAAKRALQAAGVDIAQIAAIKTHNPFAVNDIVFAKATGVDVIAMNAFGCSLIWGHPQAPMGLRSIIELIEQLVLQGGGLGLFAGCAAGDTAMAVVIEVTDRR